jgi:hypothetical protein
MINEHLNIVLSDQYSEVISLSISLTSCDQMKNFNPKWRKSVPELFWVAKLLFNCVFGNTSNLS